MPRLKRQCCFAKEATEVLLAVREQKKINVRRPLTSATLSVVDDKIASLAAQVKQHVMRETNVKTLSFAVQESEEKLSTHISSAVVDETLSADIEREWLQREFVRRVQQFRKNNKMKREDQLALVVTASSALQNKLTGINDELKKRMGLSELLFVAEPPSAVVASAEMQMPEGEKIVLAKKV